MEDDVTVRGLSSIKWGPETDRSTHAPLTITVESALGSQFFTLTETAGGEVLIKVPGGDPRGQLPGLPTTPRSIAEAVGLLILAMSQAISAVDRSHKT